MILLQFKEKNPHFPITVFDWAIKQMARRVINNKSKYILFNNYVNIKLQNFFYQFGIKKLAKYIK